MRDPQGHTYEVTVKGKKRWQADRFNTVAGRKVRITGRGGSPKEAWDRLEQNYLKRLVKFGEAPPTALRALATGESLTVGEWLERWFQTAKVKGISPNARFRQRGLIRNHILPHIGSRNLRDLTPDHIEELLLETLPEKTNPDGSRMLGSSPIRGVYYILKPAMTEAWKKGRVGYDLFAEIDPPSKDAVRSERIEDKLWIPSAIHRRTRKRRYWAYWILASYGLRQSERLGLCWEQFINLDRDDGSAVLIIDRQLYNNAEEGRLQLKMEPKSKAGLRVIPLTESVRTAFVLALHHRKFQLEEPGFDPAPEFADLCFLDKAGNPIRQNDDNRQWAKLLKELEIPHMRQHGMRHICATLMAQNGTPAEVAMSILGHGSKAMTSYYTHIGTIAKQPAVKALEDVMTVLPERH